MPPRTDPKKKTKSFNEVCSNFAEACSGIESDANNPANELLDLLKASTENSQALNESEMTAVKVMQLLLPAVNVLSSTMIIKNCAVQDAKIEKIYSAVRLNAYAIDNQNQYSRRENLRIAGINEEEGEDLFSVLVTICDAMNLKLNKSDIVSCHRVGKKGIQNNNRTVIMRTTRDFKAKIFANKKGLHGKPDFKNIYFNDDLTTLKFKLFQIVRKLDNVKAAHTRDGKIHCILKDNSRQTVENPDDLFKLVKEGNSSNRVSSQVIVTAHSSFVNSDNGVHVNSVKEGNSSNRVSSQVIVTAHSSFVNSDNGENSIDTSVQNTKSESVKSNSCDSVKVLALNVCDLKSKLKSPELEVLCNNYDILCFSESKLDQYDVINIKHFKSLPPLNRKNAKRKSGGIIVFVRDYLFENVEVLNSSNENVLWFILDNNVFDYATLFGAVYIPPESSNYSNIDIFDVLERDIIKYTAETRCKVCLLGDFNAHTGTKTDFTEINDYVLNSVQLEDVINSVNLETLGIDVSRNSLDLSVNNYGNRLLQLCQNIELLIVNGRLGKDKGIGALTCKNTTIVDYCILSPELFPYISEFEVLPFDPMLSDVHNALHVKILCKLIDVNKCMNSGEPSTIVKAVWDSKNLQSFNDCLNDENIVCLNDKLDAIDIASVSKDSINSLIEECNNIIIQAASECGMLKEKNIVNNNCNRNIKNCKVKKPWFNQECYTKRKDYHKAKSYNWRVKSVESKNNLIRCSKAYKKVCNLQYNEYRKNFIKKLRNLSQSDPKSYWSLLNKSSNTKTNVLEKISLECFHDHFKKLSNVQHDQNGDFTDDIDCNAVTNLNFELNSVITVDEVVKAIKSLKNNKSSGTDLILNEFLKNSCQKMIDIYSRVVVFLSVGINNIPEDIYGRTGEDLDVLYKRIVKKFNQIEIAVKTVAFNAKVVIATIPPKELERTIRKYPHKSEKLGTLTRNHQQSYENFVCRINEDFINDFNQKETQVHIPLHRALRQHRGRRGSVFSYNKLRDGLHPDHDLKKHWMEMIVSRLEQCI
ncbi:unnamed protein product [Mytilus edulis]|uniref:Endonuclease/exonuclease/phosphatase domain-containing protein n=1 Tax=Mytilus edulis TaxID=6550 RepID=A0A8S3SMA0_MYTED|nr:unnamed protein product [Mytilus edulis]